MELTSGKAHDIRISDTDQFHLSSPFGESPNDDEIRAQYQRMKEANIRAIGIQTRATDIRASGTQSKATDIRASGYQSQQQTEDVGDIRAHSKPRGLKNQVDAAECCSRKWKLTSHAPPSMLCLKCGVSVVDYLEEWMDTTASRETKESDYLPIRLIIFSDSANAVSSIASLHPRSNGKLTCIILAYLRGVGGRAMISFIDAITNLADTGAKNNSNRMLFYKICEYRTFSISFMCRELLKAWKKAPEKGGE